MESRQTSLTALDHLIFDGETVRLGTVVAGPEHPEFRDDGPVHHYAIQFHRTAVGIVRSRGRQVVDPSRVALFSEGETFERRAIHPRGEQSFWLAFDRGLLASEELELLEATVDVPVSRPTFLAYLALGQELRIERDLDPMAVEETALGLLSQVLADSDASGPRTVGGRGRGRRETRRAIERVQAVRWLLGARYAEALSLADIGRELGSSPFHLARNFRRATGQTIHRYRMELRLREAVHRLCEDAKDLTNLALDLGFNSHSHFTGAFTAAFSVPPSAMRELCRRGDHRRLFSLCRRPSDLMTGDGGRS